MQIDTKYNILMWSLTMVVALTLFSLGIIALVEKQLFVSWRFISGWSQGAGAIVIGWLFLGAASVVLAFQLKLNKYWFASRLVYVLFVISLVIYVLFNTYL